MTGRITEYRRGSWTFDVVDEGPLVGIPIVLLHGFPQRAASWGRVAPLLHAKGFRTYAPDQRGYSPRARPRRRRDYRQSELVDDVLALIDEIGTPDVHVVGHDWGAMVAWALAIREPDRVRTLTTLSVPHPGAFLAAMPRGQILKSWYMLLFQIPWLPEKLLALGLRQPGAARKAGLPESDDDHLATDIVAYGALPGALNWYRAMLIPDKRLRMRRVHVPTTYVWSDGDVALGRTGARLCGSWVDAPYEFVTLRRASHWLPETRPAEVAKAIIDRAATADERAMQSAVDLPAMTPTKDDEERAEQAD
ncbi:alpha/beta fold hydrolase [Gordonia sp. NPDC003422]